MIKKHINLHALFILLTMLALNILTFSTISYAASTIYEHDKIRYSTLVLPVNRIEALIGLNIKDIKEAVICYDGEQYVGNIWLLPDEVIETSLYGSIVEIPIINRDTIKRGDVLLIEIPVIGNSSPERACPWGLSHALARIHNRIEIVMTVKNSEKSIVRYPIFIYYDDKANYDKHLEIAPISLIKKLAEQLNVDYHDITTLKKKLLALGSSRYLVDYIKTETMKMFVFSKDYSKLLNDPITGHSTEEALEICPTCPVLDGGGEGTTEYESELYFYLTRKEDGGPVMPPSSDERNVSTVYLGRGTDIKEISLYLVGGSMSENDYSTLYFKLVLQKNSTNNLFDENTWTNITLKSYYLELGHEPTYMTLKLSNDQLNLEADQFYRIVVEFQWVYGSQSYLYSAVLGVKKVYNDITLQNLPGNPSATMKLSQTRTVGDYFSPSNANPINITSILKPLSGAVYDTFNLHIDIHVWPDWTKSFTSSISFTIKIYINGVLKRTVAFTLYYSQDKDVSLNVYLHRSDFLYKGGIQITYRLERSPTDQAYGDFTAQAYLNSVEVFPDVWNTINPYPYVWGGLPAIQKTLNNYIRTEEYNETILSSYIMTPVAISKYCNDPNYPLIRTYYFIHDDAGIRSWELVISSNYEIPYITVADNINPEEIPYISLVMNGLIIGFNVFITYVTSGLDLLPQIIIQLATGTTGDLVSFFVSKLGNEEVYVVQDGDEWKIMYSASLGSNRTDLSVVFHIAVSSSLFCNCQSAPSGYVVDISIDGGDGLYFRGGEHVKTYVYVFLYSSEIPGYAEPSNWNVQSGHGIRYG